MDTGLSPVWQLMRDDALLPALRRAARAACRLLHPLDPPCVHMLAARVLAYLEKSRV